MDDFGLTEMQKSFILFLCLSDHQDPYTAVIEAGYSHGLDVEKMTADGWPKAKQDNFIYMQYRKYCTNLLKNPKIVKAIAYMKEKLDQRFVVDEMFVVTELKKIVKGGTEPGKLKALELLGKTLKMFTEVQKIETNGTSPAEIARANFRKSIQESQSGDSKIVEFTGTNDE
jgi:hypothetical protein